MRRSIFLVLAVTCALAAKAQDFPCKLNDYRVMNPTTLVVLCDALVVAPSAFSATGSLFLVQDESIVHPAVQDNVIGKTLNVPWWLSFTFGKPLEGGKDYELQFAG